MGCHCVSRKSDVIRHEFKIENQLLNESEKRQPIALSKKQREVFHQHSPSTEDESSAYGKDIISTKELLAYINDARQSPIQFREEIKRYQSLVVMKNNRSYLQVDNSTFINLFTGIEAFHSAILFLNTQPSLRPYTMLEQLKLPFPSFNPEKATDYSYLNKILFQKAKELKDQFDIVNFHYDQIVYNPQLAIVLQVVDDTNSGFIRRRNLFQREAKYIGISGGKVRGNVYCFYYLFAKERNTMP